MIMSITPKFRICRRCRPRRDGYNIGGIAIYNPWSIINYVNREN